ncbi:MAG: TetR/AcrR family transcriptional regulator [Actinobacteria bacterium]|nr:TetR/AcrR family transcriptional regulator [Actinomycetota bacterium]
MNTKIDATKAQHVVGKAASFSAIETRILDSTKLAIEKWGVSRFTVADVCGLANVSRATLYRMFPGGKEVLLEALHVRSLDEFFTTLLERAQNAESLEDLLVRCVVSATTELRNDDHLAMMLATEPGTTLMQFTIDGLSRIVRVAASYLAPLVGEFLPKRDADALVEVLARLVISYFLTPSEHFDFTDEASVRKFLRAHVVLKELTN